MARGNVLAGLKPRRSQPQVYTGTPYAHRLGAAVHNLTDLRIPIITWDQPIVQYGNNVAVWHRDDFVLRALPTSYRDEREYRLMRNEPAISNSINGVVSTLLAKGYGLVTKRSRRHSPAAALMKSFAEQALRSAPGIHSFLEVAPSVVWDGWLPVQSWWKTDAFTFRGKSYWSIDQFNEMPPELFGVTPNRDLAWLGFSITETQPEILNDPIEKLGWSFFTAGGSRSPYGRARLQPLWLTWYLKQQMRQYYSRGVRNAAQGIMIFQQKLGSALANSAMMAQLEGDGGAIQMRQYENDAVAALRFLEETGSIILTGDMDFKLEKIPALSETYAQVLSYLDREMTIGIELQQLTSSEGQHGGNRALGEVQERTKIEGVQSVARHVEPIMQQAVENIIQVNFGNIDGVEVDPDDIPDWKFRVAGTIDPTRLKAFTDMGGVADAQEVADDWNIPMVDPSEPAGPVLKLQAAAPSPGPKPSAADDDSESGPKTPGIAPPKPEPGDSSDPAL